MKRENIALKLIILLLISTELLSNTIVFDFENTSIGKLPANWIMDETNPRKPLGTWRVIKDKTAPSGEKVLNLTKAKTNYGSTFNLCYNKKINFLNGEISVKFKAQSGVIDQGGGIMWRVQDGNNYYVARFNPLEDNFRFYVVKKGRRYLIESTNIKLKKDSWNSMKIVQNGNYFQGYINNKKVLESKNDKCIKSGGVGLWTKADAFTSFDDFSVKVDLK